MIDLRNEAIAKWFALLPPDFQEAIGGETRGDATTLQTLSTRISTCTTGQEIALAREIAGEVAFLARVQRIRWLAWLAANCTHRQFAMMMHELNRLGVDEEGSGEGGLYVFRQDYLCVATLAARRALHLQSISAALAAISEAAQRVESAPELLS